MYDIGSTRTGVTALWGRPSAKDQAVRGPVTLRTPQQGAPVCSSRLWRRRTCSAGRSPMWRMLGSVSNGGWDPAATATATPPRRDEIGYSACTDGMRRSRMEWDLRLAAAFQMV